MGVGELITFFLLANQFFAPIAIIGNQYNQALIAMAGAERVFRLVDTPPDWEDDPKAIPLSDPQGWPSAPRAAGPLAQESGARSAPPTLPIRDGMRIEFRNIS